MGRRRAVPSHWSQIIASCFVVWCLGPGASHLWGRAVARASLRNYPLPIAAAAATEPPASAGPYSPRRPAAPPTAQTQGTPLPGPKLSSSGKPRLGLSLCAPRPQTGVGRSRASGGLSPRRDLKESFWSDRPRRQPGPQDWAPGTRLALRNIWTGVAPVGTCSQFGLELPATLIPGRKH